jgi:hypothetical protein
MRYFDGTPWTNDYADAAQQSANAPRRRPRGWVLALVAAACLLAIGAFLKWNPFPDPDISYMNDVKDHAHGTGLVMGCPTSNSLDCLSRPAIESLGESACAGLRGGATGAQEVAKVAAGISQRVHFSQQVSAPAQVSQESERSHCLLGHHRFVPRPDVEATRPMAER